MDRSMFWNASIENLKRGFLLDEHDDCYICLICGETFKRGVIYPIDNVFFDAQKAIDTHVKSEHPPIFEFYLELGRIYTGLSAGQEELARLFYEGHTDKEIVDIIGASSASTIRNQRFSIREKYKQAKILVALVELLEERLDQLKRDRKNTSDGGKLVDFHLAATSVDERYAITQSEKDEVLERYFGPDDRLLIKEFPVKEKKKIIILQKIMTNFAVNSHYTEMEINEILKQYYDDFATVRRYLIQYGFLDRSTDGASYWIKLM